SPLASSDERARKYPRAAVVLSVILIGALAFVLEGDSARAQQSRELAVEEQPGLVPDPREEQLPAALARQAVFYRTNEPVGTLIIDTVYRYLYLVQDNSRAMRYGIGVGREGFEWQGLLRVSRKVEWPDWTPSPEVIKRQPRLPRLVKGGPGNPLGARALY